MDDNTKPNIHKLYLSFRESPQSLVDYQPPLVETVLGGVSATLLTVGPAGGGTGVRVGQRAGAPRERRPRRRRRR